jgi:hypothetical protein
MKSNLVGLGKILGQLLLLVGFCVSVLPPAHAQSEGGLENYRWRFTGYWWFSQPSGFFNGKNDSGEFDLNKDFHFGSYSTFTGSADWRFKRKHHLLFVFSPVSYSKDETLLRTITFQGETYNVGTRVSSDIRSFSFAPGYQWDFIRRDHGYVALSTLAYLLDTSAKLSGTAVVNGQTTTGTNSGSFFAPLPTIGIRTRWYPVDSGRVALEGSVHGMYFFGYGDFYSAHGQVDVGLSRHWKATAGYQMGTRLSIHGGSNNIGIRLTQKGPVVGIESSWGTR